MPLRPAAADREELHAVVVPDLAVFRTRRIVNLRELIRFELEGLSIDLPDHDRVEAFDITLDPLPRTPLGDVDRAEVAARYRDGRLRGSPAGETEAGDDHERQVVSLVERALRQRARVRPYSNLELDLGLDSLGRVELLASLEECFHRRIPDEVTQTMFTVRDLAEALRGSTAGEHRLLSWDALISVDEPDETLRAIRPGRPLTAMAVFAVTHMLVRALGRPAVQGLEHLPRETPFIITPNHQTYVDPFVLMGVLPFSVLRRIFFVGAAEYFEAPLAAWLAKRLNIVPVDPDANLLSAMRAGAYGLKHGKVLVLFPEGERSIDGRVKTFKKGAAILSQQLAAPIVPVAISGMFEIWPRNRPLTWRLLPPWSGHRVSIRFGPPLTIARGTPYADHIAAVRAAVDRL